MSTTALVVTTPPNFMPVSLEKAKKHLRVRHSSEDDYIDDLTRAACAWAETETRRKFISQEVTISMDRFPLSGQSYWFRGDVFNCLYYNPAEPLRRNFDSRSRDRAIFLPGGKVTAVESIAYVDEAGAPQTLTGPTSGVPGTDYQEDLTDEETAFVFPADDSFWPAVDLGVVNNVVITFTVGYGASPADVPADILQAIKFRIGDLFNVRSSTDNKGGAISRTASDLLEIHRIEMY